MPACRLPVRRDLEFERELTRQAARGYVDPAGVIERAETRAHHLSGEYVPDPLLIAPGRDRIRDAREEALDARNHLLFWAQENVGDERADRMIRALRFFLLAYQELEAEEWLD